MAAENVHAIRREALTWKNVQSAKATAPSLALSRSFWVVGYEGADHINSLGQTLELNTTNGHWTQLSNDHSRLSAVGILTIRESIGWRASTTACNQIDLTSLRPRAEIAQAHGFPVTWTIHHYGPRRDADFFAPDFSERFVDFCAKVSQASRGVSDGPAIYQPVNEISFLSWAVAHCNLINSYDCRLGKSGYEFKCRLVAATLPSCDAIWSHEPMARLFTPMPLSMWWLPGVRQHRRFRRPRKFTCINLGHGT